MKSDIITLFDIAVLIRQLLLHTHSAVNLAMQAFLMPCLTPGTWNYVRKMFLHIE